jgi:3-keto-disaccharide hydrolase
MLRILLLLVMLAIPRVTFASDEPVVPDGFTALFNGQNLDGWWGASTEDPRGWMTLEPEALAEKKERSRDNIRQHWRVDDGQLVNDGDGLYLTTNKNYADFELILDYKTVPGADSGIYLRGIPQIQIWDTTEAGGKWGIGADKGSGGLWNNAEGAPGKDPLVLADKPFGQWNHFRVVMVGQRVSVWFNDQLVVDHARLANYFDREKPVPRTGPIQLQTHGGQITWRNVAIREINPAEANEILQRRGFANAQHSPPTFTTIFNGQDFTGWSGPTENYEVVDGAIRCRPGHGGTIYTDATYDDFQVRFEFLLPPGGNNGLAIRYPGSGDTAYVGMCELQVLDNTSPKFAKLDPRQYHGSAYGQAPAHRGYLRKPGIWNFQEVTVKGSTITVELNGTVILDTDLSKVTDFMYPAEKFKGRTRTQGHFGFAGHNDPVAYRKIEIRELKD